MQIPPLTETAAAIERHNQTQTVLVARNADRMVGSARGIVEGRVCIDRSVSVEEPFIKAWSVDRAELTISTVVPENVAFYQRRCGVVDALPYQARFS